MSDQQRTEIDLSRRRLLQVGGAGAIAATAGCLDLFDDGAGDVPDYATYVPVSESDDGDGEEAFVVYLDIEALNELEDQEEDGGGSGGDDFPDDPVLGFPIAGSFVLLLFAGFTLGFAGLGGLIDEEDDSFDSQVGEFMLAGNAVVMTGDIDTAEIGETLTSAGDEETFGPSYEEVDEIGDYTVYADPSNEGEDEMRYAVGSEEIFLGSEGELQQAIETANGERERAHEAFDEFEWLLSAAGHGTMVTGAYSPDGDLSEGESGEESTDPEGEFEDFQAIESADGGLGSLTFDDDNREVNAEFALTFEELSEDTRSELEDSLGSLAEESSVEFDDNRVTAEATYSEEALAEASGGTQGGSP